MRDQGEYQGAILANPHILAKPLSKVTAPFKGDQQLQLYKQTVTFLTIPKKINTIIDITTVTITIDLV